MNLDNIRIKNLEREDVPSFREMAAVVNSRDNLEASLPDHVVEYLLSKDDIRKDLFLAYAEDKLIGFAGCMRNTSQSKNANFQVIIHPDHRRQGLGGKMYEYVLGRAKENGIEKATAFVKESIADAKDFTLKRGFRLEKYMWKMDLQMKGVVCKELAKEQYSIRKLTIEDGKDYADIMNAGFKKEGEELYTDKSFEITFKNPDACVFAIEVDEKMISTAAVTFEKDINRGYIYNVTVYQDYRGKGYGEVTLNHCINMIKEAGLEKAALGVDGTNSNALNLYKKLGFVEADTHILFEMKLAGETA